MSSRTQSTLIRRHPVLALTLAPALVLSACSMPWSGDPVEDFISDFNEGDWAAAAEHTTDPEATEARLTELEAGIGAEEGASVELSLDDGSSDDSGSTTARWTVPGGDEATTSGTVSTDPESGLVRWSPTILSSEAPEGSSIVYSNDLAVDTPVVDRGGNDLLTWTNVTVVSAGEDQLDDVDAIADAVRPVLPDMDADWIAEQINGSEDGAVALFSLRDEDMEQVRGGLEAVDGLGMREEGRLLSASREVSTPVDQSLSDYWTETLTGSAGWSLTASTSGEQVVLEQQAPEPVEAIRTTLDLPMQAAAQQAVDAEDRPASIVALSPQGSVLAVAQNAAATGEGQVALTGMYPPGSTFKTVTTAAALETGSVTADQIVDCPAEADIDDRVIPNNDNFELGQVPMHTAFAESCNTTQGFISQDFEPSTMRDTALSLGLGVDFEAPGLTTITGSVPDTDPGAARVEAAIGQGEVLATPFGMALMEASLANGGPMAVPRIIDGAETTADQYPEPLSPETVDAVRAMMVETVTSGSASSLSDIAGLGGKTGTAEIGGSEAHGWFTGISGEGDGAVAFATFIEGAGSSGPAVEMTGTFLRSLG